MRKIKQLGLILLFILSVSMGRIVNAEEDIFNQGTLPDHEFVEKLLAYDGYTYVRVYQAYWSNNQQIVEEFETKYDKQSNIISFTNSDGG